MNSSKNETLENARKSIELPPRPTSGMERRKSTFRINGAALAKAKHLFLNEEDVDTYITYPPKEEAAAAATNAANLMSSSKSSNKK